MTRYVVLLLAGIGACTNRSAEQTGDTTTAVAAIDTLKPAAGDSAGVRDSLGAAPGTTDTAPGTKAATKTGATTTPTGTKTAPRDTTNIGRDVAIPLDTRNPKVYLPTVDTGRKRPPG